MQKIISIPALKDNYIWLMRDSQSGHAIVVDPGVAEPVLAYLKAHSLELIAILVTHKHADHTGGIAKLVETFPNVKVYAHRAENIALMTDAVDQDDCVWIPGWHEPFRVIHIPGHTMGHVAYIQNQILFSGDTLFGAGCGRVFEGTPDQMLASLEKLQALPDETEIYCGHEYTLANLAFALKVEPDNMTIQDRIDTTKKLRENNLPSLPSTIGLEKLTNPFFRCREKSVISSVTAHTGRQLIDTVDVFHTLREWKNNVKIIL